MPPLNRLPPSLSQVLLRRLLAAYLVFAAVITGIQLFDEYRDARREIEETLNLLANTFAPGAEAAIWDYQENLVNALASGIGANPAVVYVAIGDQRGNLGTVWHATVNHQASAQLTVTRPLYHLAPDGHREMLGTLRIASSEALVFARLRENLVPALLSTLAQLLFLGFMIWLLIRKLVVRPVGVLTDQVQRLAEHKLDQPLAVEGCSEFRQLAESFNRMAERIVSEQTLLEQRVTERTAQLQKSEATLRHAQRVACIGSWHFDREGVGLTWSEENYRIFGVAKNTPVNYQNFLAFVHPDDRQAVDTAWQAALRGAPYDVTHRIVVEGETKWVREQAELVFNDDGVLQGGVGTTQDITQQVFAERAQHASEARFRSIFERANSGIAFADAQGNLLQFNDAFAQLLAYPREELMGVNFASFTHPDDVAAEITFFEEILARRRDDYRLEKRYLTRSGKVVWVDVAVAAIRDEQGNPVNFVGLVVDISERKAMEQVLQQSEERFRQMFENMSSGCVVYQAVDDGADFIFRDVNAAVERIEKTGRETLIGRRLRELFPGVVEIGLLAVFQSVWRDGQPRSHPLSFYDDGKITGWRENFVYRLDSGELVVIYDDVTARKQTEEALVEAKQAAEAASRAKSEFLANMSHEIRTPMNAIIGLTQLVLESELTAQQEDYLGKVQRSSRALLGILNDILDYSKIEAGRLEIACEPLRVEAVLRDAADLFEAQIEEKGLELFLEIAPDVPGEVQGDAMRLSQVLTNLIGNAVKFTEHGIIHVTAEALPSEGDIQNLRFSVRDTGIGLSTADATQIFQPFTQADGSITRKYGGTGLGLAISRRLVDLMGGQINVSSSPGQGATFAFTVRTQAVHALRVAPDFQQLGPLKVLVVDDQETSRAILTRLLSAWGLRAEAVASGEEALHAVATARDGAAPFEAVLLDWRMPGMAGAEVARRLAGDGSSGSPARPLVVPMANAYERQSLLASRGPLRFASVLKKPVTPSLLFDALVKGRDSLVTASPPAAREGHTAGIPQIFAGTHILLAEDNPANQEVAAAFLRRRGADVTTAVHGGEAVEWVRRRTFDALLMDVHMPIMDGLEATRLIRTLPHGQNLPIIAMTAAVMAEDRSRCQAAGMVDFIAKPINPGALSTTLSKWLPATGNHPAAPASAVSPPPATSLLDFEQTLRRLDGDQALLDHLLSGFAAERAGAGEYLRALLASGDVPQACDWLHTLKGVAGNLGAGELAQACSRLEKELGEGGASSSHAAFDAALSGALGAIHTYLAGRSPGVEPVSTGLPLNETLAALKPYLEERELVPDELMKALQMQAHACPPGAALKRLVQQIDQFDHDGALLSIAQIGAETQPELPA